MSAVNKKFDVQGMSCSHCVRAVKNALAELNGVTGTEVDLEAGTVTVDYDEALVSESSLKDAIEDAGYTVV